MTANFKKYFLSEKLLFCSSDIWPKWSCVLMSHFMSIVVSHHLSSSAVSSINVYNSIFFSETTGPIEIRIGMNVHWTVLYNLKVFCSDMKFQMAATAGLSLTLDPMEKMFQNASSLKPLGQLKPNCPGIIIGRSSTNFCFLCRSEIQNGRHRRT